jgi:hypothetical protein
MTVALTRPRVPLTTALLSLALAAAVLFLAPHGMDFAAHLYQRRLFLDHGFRLWNNHWYAGRYSFVGYSLLYYPMSAVVGITALAIASIVAAVAAFALLLERQWGASARPAAYAFAVVWPITAVTGAFPFLLGSAFALAALVAVQRRRNVLFAVLALLSLFSSPLAFGFLALVSISAAVGARERRVVAPALALGIALAVEIVLARLFPAGGSFPFPWPTLLGALTFAAIGAALTWNQSRLLFALFAVYGVTCLVSYVVPSELGANVVRIRFVALPLAFLVLALRRFRPRFAAVGALALASAWTLIPLGSAIVQAADDPASAPVYWRPAITFLQRHLTPSYRVEAVATADHWEALYLPRAGIPIARGWFRQDDLPQNELLYKPLQPGRYVEWLRSLGVRYVLLTDAPLDYSARREATLLRSGRAGLPIVHRFANGVVYGVPSPHEMIEGPGAARVRSLADTTVLLQVAARGTYRLAFRYSSYWTPSRGCLSRRQDGMTNLSVPRAGTVTLSFAPSVGGAIGMLDGRARSCADTD